VDDLRPRPSPRGQHFLLPRLCADLVRNAGVTKGDLVVEIGAGTGSITRELVRRAGRVVAIEVDPKLAALVRSGVPTARVVEGDALRVPLPREPFRVVANVPFAHTTALLKRLLDDPTRPLLRADLIVAWGFAVKRCSQRPSSLLTMSWAPWFELTITRRLPASSFRPPPPVDAAVMTVTRRPDPLLDVGERRRYAEFLRRAFRGRRDATDLDVWQWTQMFRNDRGRFRAG
jgi:23S rRNA (adenine-N6)-dimethyltransferase